MFAAFGKLDPRLVALDLKENSVIDVSDEKSGISVAGLLKSSKVAGTLLSKECMAVFNGNKERCSNCRLLDVLAYGADFLKLDESIHRALVQGDK
jgi:hypothetical protein